MTGVSSQSLYELCWNLHRKILRAVNLTEGLQKEDGSWRMATTKICIQIHFNKIKPDTLCCLAELGDPFTLDNLIINEDHLNLTLQTEEPVKLWKELKSRLEKTTLGEAALVVCTGKNGWDDHLLLHSFDPEEKLDELEQ